MASLRKRVLALMAATVLVTVLFAIWASNAPTHFSGGSCGFPGDLPCPEGAGDGVDTYGVLVLWGIATAVLAIIWCADVGSPLWRRSRRRRAEGSRVAQRG